MPKRDPYLAAYDSPSDRRRARLLGRVRGFGVDPQYSFHVVRLTAAERREMWETLSGAADAAEDSLFMVRLGPDALVWRFGRPPPEAEATAKAVAYVG